MVCGEFSYKLASDSSATDCRSSVLIPAVCQTDSLEIISCSPLLSYILIVEKHTIYNQLMSSRYHMEHHCIIITGKGFPCYSTREFLIQLTLALPLLPILALVDCDPDGLSIYSCYKHGSVSSSRLREKLGVGKVQLMGLEVEEVQEIQQRVDGAKDGRTLAVKPLTDRDVRKINKMLNGQPAQHDVMLQSQHNRYLLPMLRLCCAAGGDDCM
jgi:DNA topoisomerase VI subunit A